MSVWKNIRYGLKNRIKMKHKIATIIVYFLTILNICLLIFWGGCRSSGSESKENEIEFFIEEGSKVYDRYEAPTELPPEEAGECDEIGSYREEDIYQVHEDCGLNCYACVKRIYESPGPCLLDIGPVPNDYMCGCYEGKCRWFRYR